MSDRLSRAFAGVLLAVAATAAPGQAIDVETLVGKLKSPNVEERRAAAAGLYQAYDSRTAAALTAALTDGDRLVRLWAARAMARGPVSTTVQPLLAALGDPDAEVRKEAAEALIWHGAQAYDSLAAAARAAGIEVPGPPKSKSKGKGKGKRDPLEYRCAVSPLVEGLAAKRMPAGQDQSGTPAAQPPAGVRVVVNGFTGDGDVTLYDGVKPLGSLKQEDTLELRLAAGIHRLRLEFSEAPCERRVVWLACLSGECTYEVAHPGYGASCTNCWWKPVTAAWSGFPAIEEQLKRMTPAEAVGVLNSSMIESAKDPGPPLQISGAYEKKDFLNRRFRFEAGRGSVEWETRTNTAASAGAGSPIDSKLETRRLPLSMSGGVMKYVIQGRPLGQLRLFPSTDPRAGADVEFKPMDTAGLYRLMAALLLVSGGR
jgi:hypothetical protein